MPFHCAKNTLVAKFVSTVKCKFQSLLLEASHRAVVAQISFSRAGIVEDLVKKKYSDNHSWGYKKESGLFWHFDLYVVMAWCMYLCTMEAQVVQQLGRFSGGSIRLWVNFQSQMLYE